VRSGASRHRAPARRRGIRPARWPNKPRLGLALACLWAVALGGPAAAGDAKVGRQKALQCQACHGLDGFAKIPDAPHLAGQVEAYLVKSLTDYKTGARKHEMMTVVMQTIGPADIEDLAAYYAAIEIEVKPP
jgi:cytochrome c553